MNVLIATASRHGSTAELGRYIGDRLAAAGHTAEVAPLAQVEDPAAYDALVLGSAVYVGRWLPEAVAFVEQYRETLRDRPVWLFSSGPIGDPPMPRGEPEGLAALTAELEPRDQRVFSGRVVRSELSLAEKVIMSVVRAPEGDFRDWPVVAEWADQIAGELRQLGASPVA